MLLAYFYRYIERYKVIVEGVSCEKLISDMLGMYIPIENIKVMDDVTVSFWCVAKDFESIKALADKKYVIEIVELK